MKDFINWLITSSADPTKVALSVKGSALVVGAIVVQAAAAACSFGLKCFGIDASLVNEIAGGIYTIVYAAMLLFGGFMVVGGVIRKFYLGRWSHPDASVV